MASCHEESSAWQAATIVAEASAVTQKLRIKSEGMAENKETHESIGTSAPVDSPSTIGDEIRIRSVASVTPKAAGRTFPEIVWSYRDNAYLSAAS
jgi:hypothetical protein